MNTAALLALIGDLYAQVASLQAQLDAERQADDTAAPNVQASRPA